MTKLRIGILGCGRIAQFLHLPALAKLRDVELAALADTRPDNLAEARRHAPDAVVYSSWQELIDNAPIDAVINCLPTPLHASSALATLGRGLPLYLEKPMAHDLPAAEELERNWRTKPCFVQLGFNFRFHPNVVRARKLIEQGAVGRVVAVSTTMTNRITYASPPDPASPRSAVVRDLAVHHIDLVTFLLQEQYIQARASRHCSGVNGESARLDLLTESDIPVNIFVSNEALRLDQILIIGEKNSIHIDRFGGGGVRLTQVPGSSWRSVRFRGAAHLLRGVAREGLLSIDSSADESYRRALSAFTRQVVNPTEKPDLPGITDGIRAERVLHAIEESLHADAAVKIDP